MKNLFLTVMVLILTSTSGYCETRAITVKLATETPEIFNGQSIDATVVVTNTGTNDIQLPRPDRTGFSDLLSIDNPQLYFSGGVGIISFTGESPTVTVKPGESISTPVNLSGNLHGLSPIVFRMGFKVKADAAVVWSNPVTVEFKKDQGPLVVQMNVSLVEDKINIADIQNVGQATGQVKITNISQEAQNIGMDGVCGLHELMSGILISDNPDIVIDSGIASCLKSISGPGDVVLNPGESYEQQCRVIYQGMKPNPAPLTFRIGLKKVGHLPVWSNSLTVNVVGGTDQWEKHMIYLKNLEKEYQNPPPVNGVVKKYYESGALMEERTYKDSKLNGPYKTYFENGQVSQDLNYADGKQSGPYKNFDKDGKVTQQGVNANGQIVWYKTYNADGTIHGNIKFLKEENGNYVPLPQGSCTEADSDQEVLKMFPLCK
jgi:hypothetical protein